MKKFLANLGTLFGFNKNTKYVDIYIRESNVRSGVFLAAVIIIIEIWMIIRQLYKYIIPSWPTGGTFMTYFDLFFSNTSYFFLFLFVGISVFTFCYTHQLKRLNPKKNLIVNGIVSGVAILYSFFIFKEPLSWSSVSKSLSSALIIAVYVLAFSLSAIIVLYCLLVYLDRPHKSAVLNFVMILFSAMVIAFGVRVSYSDYISKNPKEIICFLTMVMYGACLLIWRPYISIILNTALFIVFYQLIIRGSLGATSDFLTLITTKFAEDGSILIPGVDPNSIIFTYYTHSSYIPWTIGEQFTLSDWNAYLVSFKDGDLVNYITFLISLTMVSVSLYHQRRNAAIKDEELEYLANYDELTGMNNYASFIRDVSAIKNRAGKRIVFVNVDNFKTFNDQRGFAEGNKFLKRVGDLINEQFKGQITCRQSDDHYALFISEEGFEDNLIELNEKVKTLDPDIVQELKFGSYKPHDEEDVRRAVDKARYACSTIKMDHAKLHVEYDRKMHNEYHLKQYVIHSVDKAVQEGWIKPYYQPVVWSKDGKLCGVEALARWEDPVRGMLSPGCFVPALEETKLIHKLDAWIIEKVCIDLREALDFGDNPVVPVSINFSRLDFELMNAVDHLETMMQKYNIPKDLIHVEVTESALTDSDTKLFEDIHELKNRGYALWLDDFGSGYSSLNALKDFEFDVLKIDMKFLSTFSTNPRTKSLIESIIQMANKLGMRTLTEGVETKEEVEFLKEVNCERLQGYLFGKPMPHEVLVEKIKSGEIKVSKDLW